MAPVGRRTFLLTAASIASGSLLAGSAVPPIAVAQAVPGSTRYGVKALFFDVFGTVVDWRSSLIFELSRFGQEKGIVGDWPLLVDEWRAAYYPSMDRVRRGEIPWTNLDALHRQSLEALVANLQISGVTTEVLGELTDAWCRLRPWPDVVEGMQRLSARYLLGPLSNANVALMVRLRKFAGLPWDFVFGADLWQHYKPDPEAYRGTCKLLGLSLIHI